MSLVLLLATQQQRAAPNGLGLLLFGAPTSPTPTPFVEIDPPLVTTALAAFGQGSQTFQTAVAQAFNAVAAFGQGSQTFQAHDIERFIAAVTFKQGSQTFAAQLQQNTPPTTGSAQTTRLISNMGTLMNRRGGM